MVKFKIDFLCLEKPLHGLSHRRKVIVTHGLTSRNELFFTVTKKITKPDRRSYLSSRLHIYSVTFCTVDVESAWAVARRLSD
jgi:hypothetical protein